MAKGRSGVTRVGALILLCFLALPQGRVSSYPARRPLGWLDGHRSFGPAIASQREKVAAAWIDSRRSVDKLTANYDVYFRKSTDAGQTWGKRVLVSPLDGKAISSPDIALVDGVPVVAWQHHFESKPNGLVFARLEDGQWDQDYFPGDSEGSPQLVVGPEKVWAVVSNRDWLDIYSSPLAINQWQLEGSVSFLEHPFTETPDVTGTPQGLAFSWISRVEGNQEVFAGLVNYVNLSWKEGPTRLTESGASEWSASISARENRLFLVWRRLITQRGDLVIVRLLGKESIDGGAHWGPAERITRVRQAEDFEDLDPRPVAGKKYDEVFLEVNLSHRRGSRHMIMEMRDRPGADWGGGTLITNNGSVRSLDVAGVVRGRMHVVYARRRAPAEAFYFHLR
jgi:hypothetical protein